MPLITGRNRDQERRSQAISISRTASRYERSIAREISRAMTEASKSFYKPMALIEVRVKHAENMLKILSRLWTQSGLTAVDANFTIAKSFLNMEFKRDVTTPIVDGAISDWIRTYGSQKITEITKTTMNDISSVVSRGVQDGLNEREIGKLIQGVAPSKSASRAQTIARTEAHGSSQGISLDVAGETEIPMVKIWLTNDSDTTREDHSDANGQKRALNKPFDVGGEQLDYPGDPSGSAENVINCKCVIGYEVA